MTNISPTPAVPAPSPSPCASPHPGLVLRTLLASLNDSGFPPEALLRTVRTNTVTHAAPLAVVPSEDDDPPPPPDHTFFRKCFDECDTDCGTCCEVASRFDSDLVPVAQPPRACFSAAAVRPVKAALVAPPEFGPGPYHRYLDQHRDDDELVSSRGIRNGVLLGAAVWLLLGLIAASVWAAVR
jgi:hypothetical protein